MEKGETVMRCHWEKDPEIGRWFYPGCMGGAVYGESQCTCGPKPRHKELERRIELLEERIATVERSVKVPNRKIA